MCGVFGFVSHVGRGPQLQLLEVLAKVTQTRGPHAFGLAWLDRDGQLCTYKAPGAASDHLDAMFACRDAIAVIGHCRWATHGSPADNRNNHPHPSGTGWLVHNGVVTNYADLVARHRLPMESECDSETIGRLITHAGGSLLQRAVWAANQLEGTHAVLGLWRSPARLLMIRHGRPLHVGRGAAGYYFASLPTGLPGDVRPVADGTARLIELANHRPAKIDGTAVRLDAMGGLWGDLAAQ